MKIMFMNWNSFCNEDFCAAADALNWTEEVTLVKYPFEKTDKRRDRDFEERFAQELKQTRPDIVFSFNYFPVIAEAVHAVYEEIRTRYVAWVYDCPHVVLYSYTLIYPSNDVFLFDSAMYKTFASQGIETVHYLPLAANTSRLDKMAASPGTWQRFQARVSFVGAMYTEKGTFYDRMEGKLDPYAKGYLEGLMRAQMRVNGINFIAEAISPAVEDMMQQAFPMEPNADGVETAKDLYAQYVINRKITQTERAELLSAVGALFPLALYTKDTSFHADGVQVKGAVDYYDEAPYVYRFSDINLNIALRSITAGIPLRAFDIMGAGGFLLTSFQEDMLYFFEPDKEFVYYESKEDLLEKIDFYLSHEDVRKKIAAAGHDAVARNHTFSHRLREILDIVVSKR